MLLWVFLGLIVLLSIGCCIFKDLLYVAVALAAISAILSIVLFHFGANIAGVFELSVCAGLITVLFIATVSLTKDSDMKSETRLPVYFIPLFLLIFIGIDVFVMQWLARSVLTAGTPSQTASFQKVFWEMRSLDIFGQVALILAGVFGILSLFRTTGKDKEQIYKSIAKMASLRTTDKEERHE
jgi:NADH-quinone oxidoreductase subunit J